MFVQSSHTTHLPTHLSILQNSLSNPLKNLPPQFWVIVRRRGSTFSSRYVIHAIPVENLKWKKLRLLRRLYLVCFLSHADVPLHIFLYSLYKKVLLVEESFCSSFLAIIHRITNGLLLLFFMPSHHKPLPPPPPSEHSRHPVCCPEGYNCTRRMQQCGSEALWAACFKRLRLSIPSYVVHCSI